ncbi:hypothetical protein B296_00003798 [Ensete ventricosum]|uniref:Polygalacturonase n=1 Tax=Ensete ventricosum TaxID=4639 RepID=A0A427B1S9_ENSVE|nr:hypothetical protein B296_00003798 [Ensete ventricosum]
MRSHLKPREVLRHGGHDDPGLDHSYSSSPSTADQHASYMPHSKKFNILFFGATGDGAADDSKVKNITISSPKDSPNTDGIHLQNTRDVEIKQSDIGCGDDCNSELTSDLTFQGGVGSVRNVSFSNVQVVDVDVPIVIDQYYCNRRSCRNRTDAVAISEVTYKKISGTYRFQPMNLACSDEMPCTGVALRDIELSPANETRVPREAFCWKSYGESQGLLHPLSLGCLQRPTKLLKAQMKSHNDTCY